MGFPGGAAATAMSLQSCPTLCDPTDGSHQAPPSLGFSRQEHWIGLPFPSPMHESEKEVSQSCPTLSNPMDCSLPGSSIHGIFQARVLEWGAIAFSAQVVLVVKNSPANAGEVKDAGLIPGLQRSPGGRHGNLVQYSCLENPRDRRRARWATVYRVEKSQTQLMQLNTHS